MRKLNLGCGIFYKPGYINIDIVEDKIADEIADVAFLPYEENSVDIIEASHIIEHFDINHLPFILSEWYRVLKPGGWIEIETPNLPKSVNKLRIGTYRKKLLTLKFLFGVDYRGNIHKMAFSSSFLKRVLSGTGFVKIKRKKQKSFTEEKGLRFHANKPLETQRCEKKHFITTFRYKISSHFQKEDSLFYDILENNCFLTLFDILPKDIQSFFSINNITKFCASLATIHPKLAIIFLELFPENKTKGINKEILNYLEEIKFHSLLMSDWIKWKKDSYNFLNSITSFYNHWIKKIDTILSQDNDFKEMFSYLKTLERSSNNFFGMELINIQSLRFTNQGIKAFEKGNFDEARSFLEESIRMNPSNVGANINLARLFKGLNNDHDKILEHYRIAITNIPNRKLRRKIRREHNKIILEEGKKMELGPIQLR